MKYVPEDILTRFWGKLLIMIAYISEMVELITLCPVGSSHHSWMRLTFIESI